MITIPRAEPYMRYMYMRHICRKIDKVKAIYRYRYKYIDIDVNIDTEIGRRTFKTQPSPATRFSVRG